MYRQPGGCIMTDRIEKTVELNAPVDRVWRALTDHREFGEWFKVRLDQPFVPGAESTGQMTYPGFAHMPWRAEVVAMDEPRLFSFSWPNMAEQKKVREYWSWAVVKYRLVPTEAGTRRGGKVSGLGVQPPAREG